MRDPEIVSMTQDVSGMTPEQYIAHVARVSNPSNNMNHATAPKLLAYLVREGHWSPLDMVDVTVRVETSRAIAAQGLRHWSFRFQEFSQRYATVSELNFDHVEMRMAAAGGNRQGSGEMDEISTRDAQWACELASQHYHELIASGIAPESARMVLPLATPTTLYFKGSIRSWMTYFWQRCSAHSQKEHRELATKILDLFRKDFPVVVDMVENYVSAVIPRENEAMLVKLQNENAELRSRIEAIEESATKPIES